VIASRYNCDWLSSRLFVIVQTVGVIVFRHSSILAPGAAVCEYALSGSSYSMPR